jgi:hypothetical protein
MTGGAMEALGTQYGFFSVLAIVVGAVTLAAVAIPLLIKGKMSADLRGGKFALGQDKTNEALCSINEAIKEIQADVVSLQLDMLASRVMDSNLHILQRSEAFERYKAKGGNGALQIYYNTVVKPFLEDYYQGTGDGVE